MSARPMFTAVGVLTIAIALPAHASWSMFHGDPRHSGYADADVPFDSLLAWSTVTGESVFVASPAIDAAGNIYIGNRAGRLYCFFSNGVTRWIFQGIGSFRYSTPAIAPDGTIYVGSTAGSLYAVKPDGTLKWTFTAAGDVKTSPNLATDGTIYFGCDDGHLYAVHPDGSLNWAFQTGDTIRSSPAIGPDGTIFFGSEDRYLYAVWPNGTQRWRALTGDRIKYSSPAVSAVGDVLVGSYDGFLYSFTSTGQFQWAYNTGDEIRSSPAIGLDGVSYVGSDRALYAINGDGSLRWRYFTDGEIYSSPAFSGDDSVVCVGSDDGRFYVVHADGIADGTTDWTFTVGIPIRSSPALHFNGNVVIADVVGRIWAFGVWSPNPVEVATPGRQLEMSAYPNPSAGRMRVVVSGDHPAAERLRVFDVTGREIAALERRLDGAFEWDGHDQDGVPVPAGLYLARLGRFALAGRLVILR